MKSGSREESAIQDKLYILPSRQEAEPGQASKNNLPVQLTPLIGREHEVQAACTLLRRPEVHLLTFSGTGGVGKTRLALQVASQLLNDFADGVCFVPLAPISDPQLVVATIAQTLGLKETGERALFDLLKAYLQEQHLLLVLDNFEQVLEAALRLADLLTTCPKLKMLVTSRAVLRIQGENEFPLSPLAVPDLKRLPDLATLSRYAAVALLLDRAKAIKPDFQLTQANAGAIAEICARLDGLPLAIELAAARLKLLSPQGLLARLSHRLQLLTGGARNMPLRQQTMRNTIQWSYDQLGAQEQQLFRRLSVFVGGCTLEAVEAICTALGDASANVLDRVVSLLDESLLQRVEQEGEEPRLWLLETIREFGLEHLAASGELEATQHAHATYYLSLLEKAWQNSLSAEYWQWYTYLEQEHANLRAALRWSVEGAGVTSAETVLRLSMALLHFWTMRGYVSEGRRWLEQALARSDAGVTVGRARGLAAAGMLASTQDDYAPAAAFLQESVESYRILADPSGIGFTLQKLAQVTMAQGNYSLARSLTEEALAHLREAGDKWNQSGVPLVADSNTPGDKWTLFFTGLALENLVRVAFVQGEYARAHSLAKEFLILSRRIDDRRNMVIALFYLALLTFSQGEQTAAYSLAEESLNISREYHFTWSLAFSLGLLGLLALWKDDEAVAYARLEESLAMRREVGDRWNIRWGLYCLGWVAFERWNRAAARSMYGNLIKLLRRLDDTELLATCLEALGSVVAAQGPVGGPAGEPRADKQPWDASTQWAVRLWGAAEALRKASALPLLPHQNPTYERAITAVRSQLDEEEFATAWAEGQTMKLEEVLAALRGAEMPEPLHAVKLAGTSPAGLSAREVEVLRLVAQGLTYAQVAEQLIISPRTVNWYLTVIYSKLGVSSRSAATRYAIEHNLL